MTSTHILAFDPGSIYTGWAVVSYEPLQYVASGVIKLGQGEFFQRIGALKDAVAPIIEQYRPHSMVLEQAFVGQNRDAALKLGQIRGALMAFCYDREIKYAQYTPKEAKKTVTGYGGASKEQVALMINRIFKRNFQVKDDETDALSLAVCHYFCQKNPLFQSTF